MLHDVKYMRTIIYVSTIFIMFMSCLLQLSLIMPTIHIHVSVLPHEISHIVINTNLFAQIMDMI